MGFKFAGDSRNLFWFIRTCSTMNSCSSKKVIQGQKNNLIVVPLEQESICSPLRRMPALWCLKPSGAQWWPFSGHYILEQLHTNHVISALSLDVCKYLIEIDRTHYSLLSGQRRVHLLHFCLEPHHVDHRVKVCLQSHEGGYDPSLSSWIYSFKWVVKFSRKKFEIGLIIINKITQ